jgi:hypothetical protein
LHLHNSIIIPKMSKLQAAALGYGLEFGHFEEPQSGVLMVAVGFSPRNGRTTLPMRRGATHEGGNLSNTPHDPHDYRPPPSLPLHLEHT